MPPLISIVHGIVPLRAIFARRVENAAIGAGAGSGSVTTAADDPDVRLRPVEGRRHEVARRRRRR